MSSYKIQEELGRGAQGVVYRARQIALNRPVALKILAEHLAKDLVCIQRFQREMTLLSRLRHPNIIRFFDSGWQDGRPFFAMELAEGEGLREFRDNNHPLSAPLIREILTGISGAVAHLHSAGLIHRDIKLNNVTLIDGHVPKLIDFGLARNPAAIDLTRPGVVPGTVRYFPPEIVTVSEPSTAQDVFAFGALAWELITGETFRGSGDPTPALLFPESNPIPPIRRTRPDFSKELEELIARALATDPASRPAASEIHEHLLKTGERPTKSSRPSQRERASSPATEAAPRGGSTAIPLIVILVLVAVFGWTSSGIGRSPPAARLIGSSFPGWGRARFEVLHGPPGATWTLGTTDGTSLTSGSLDASGVVEVRELPPDLDAVLHISPAGQPEIVLGRIRTPPERLLTSFLTHETANSILVHASTSEAADLEVSLRGPGGTTRKIPSPRTPGTLHHVVSITSLALDTPYAIDLAVVGAWGGVRDYQFRTWTRREERNQTAQLRLLERQMTAEPLSTYATIADLYEHPDPRCIPLLGRMLQDPALERFPLRWMIQLCRRLATPALATAVLDRRDSIRDPITWSFALALLARTGHPRTGELIREHLAAVVEPEAVRECLRSLALVQERGWMEHIVPRLAGISPQLFDPLPWMLASDAEATRAALDPWLGTLPPDGRTLHALRARADRGLPEDLEVLKILETKPFGEILPTLLYSLARDWTEGGRRSLAALLDRRPDDPARLWAAAAAGVEGVDARIEGLLARATDPALRRTAITLSGILQLGHTAPALRDILASTAQESVHPAAAWSLGRLRDPSSFESLAAIVGRAGPCPPEILWALHRIDGPRSLRHLHARLARDLAGGPPGPTAWTALLLVSPSGEEGLDRVRSSLAGSRAGPETQRFLQLAARLAASTVRLDELHFLFPDHVIYITPEKRQLGSWIGLEVAARAGGDPTADPCMLEGDFSCTLEGRVRGTVHMRSGPLVVVPAGEAAGWYLRVAPSATVGVTVLVEERGS